MRTSINSRITVVDSSTPCTKSQPVTDLAFMAVLEVGSFVNTLEKNSHTAITLRREQRCTEGTVLGDWHCTRQLRFFRNPKKTKSSTLSPALSYSLSTNKHNNLFSKRWTSPQAWFFLQAPLHCASALCEKEHQRSFSTNSRFVVCLSCFCFAWGKGGVIT